MSMISKEAQRKIVILEYEKFSRKDFMQAKDVDNILYPEILSMLKNI